MPFAGVDWASSVQRPAQTCTLVPGLWDVGTNCRASLCRLAASVVNCLMLNVDFVRDSNDQQEVASSVKQTKKQSCWLETRWATSLDWFIDQLLSESVIDRRGVKQTSVFFILRTFNELRSTGTSLSAPCRPLTGLFAVTLLLSLSNFCC